jgi:hypothetical protein
MQPSKASTFVLFVLCEYKDLENPDQSFIEHPQRYVVAQLGVTQRKSRWCIGSISVQFAMHAAAIASGLPPSIRF